MQSLPGDIPPVGPNPAKFLCSETITLLIGARGLANFLKSSLIILLMVMTLT